MQVLVYLASRSGEVVSRQQLHSAVWGDTVVSEDSLTRAICDLRQALNDDSQAPRYIETIRKRGYRLIAGVSLHGKSRRPSPAIGLLTDEAVPDRPTTATTAPKVAAICALAAAAIFCVVAIVHVIDNGTATPPTTLLLHSLPVTSVPGLEVRPSFSPDGSRIAFAMNEGRGHTFDIFVCPIEAESPLQLTDNPAYENYPTWSPDGTILAFVRAQDEQAGIYTIPATGGEQSCVYLTAGFLRHLDWSPEGQWLVFAESARSDAPSRLRLLRLDDGHLEFLTDPSSHQASDFFPRFSPAGNDVAFVRAKRSGLQDIHCVTVADGRIRELTRGQIAVRGLSWNETGDEIYFASLTGGPYNLSAVSTHKQQVRRIPVLSEWALYPARARHASRLVFESRREVQDILALTIDPRPPLHQAPNPLIVSTGLDSEPCWSPDGQAITFISNRTGHRELWICNADGTGLEQLTHLGGAHTAHPLWSPDGKRIAFMAVRGGASLYTVDKRGGEPRKISVDDGDIIPCSWSLDSNWIYYATATDDGWQVFKVSHYGSIQRRVTNKGGIAAMESPDGRYLYLVGPDQPGIWRRPLEGGDPVCVVADFPANEFMNWTVTATGIIYFVRDDYGTSIKHHNPLDGTTEEIAPLPFHPISGFSISPDGKTILLARTEHLDIDLMMLEQIP